MPRKVETCCYNGCNRFRYRVEEEEEEVKSFSVFIDGVHLQNSAALFIVQRRRHLPTILLRRVHYVFERKKKISKRKKTVYEWMLGERVELACGENDFCGR
mmetsp:Transcript_12804/g.18889  ORF Transcript_12804/g.18889 Transcript_12804/m.18889 type:complete len:101 (+) Transcript_12804:1655-1957(+)